MGKEPSDNDSVASAETSLTSIGSLVKVDESDETSLEGVTSQSAAAYRQKVKNGDVEEENLVAWTYVDCGENQGILKCDVLLEEGKQYR